MASSSSIGTLAEALWMVAIVGLPAFVAYLVPSRKSGGIRAGFAACAACASALLVLLWPEGGTPPISVVGEAGSHLLSWLIGLPLVSAAALFLAPRGATRLIRGVTLSTMGAVFLLSLRLLQVDMGRTYHFNEDVPWVAPLALRYHVAIDGISLWLVLLTVFLMPLATFASFASDGTNGTRAPAKAWCIALLALEGAVLGAFLAMDLVLFFMFCEVMLLPVYFMIAVWGGAGRIRSATRYFLFAFAGSTCMLATILYAGARYARVSNGVVSYDYFDLQRVVFPGNVQVWLWAGLAFAFFVKVPLFPLNAWIPDVYAEAPVTTSIVLAAVMKVGTYGYLRFCTGLFPEASATYATWLAGLAVMGSILYASLCASRQRDAKRLIAYASMAHLGYVMLGLFAISQASLEGAVLHMVNHGVYTAALFLLVGVIHERTKTRDLGALGGLARSMPVAAGVFVVIALASIGVPGTNGFVSEFLILTGSFSASALGRLASVQTVGATLGVLLGATYMLSAVQNICFGRPSGESAPERLAPKDMNGRELLAVAPLVAAVFLVGLFPNVLISRMSGALQRVRTDFEARHVDAEHPERDSPLRLLPRKPEAPPEADTAGVTSTTGDGPETKG